MTTPENPDRGPSCRQWRVRTLMLAAAVPAVVLGTGLGLRRRAEGFHRRAAYHLQAMYERLDRSGPVAWSPAMGVPLESVYARRGGESLEYFRASQYHDQLYRKYRRASHQPWLPVAADPPPPPRANPPVVPDALSSHLAR